ncbi:MAG: hypothetical protein AAB930_04385 [Patescibacteria group bacterium]
MTLNVIKIFGLSALSFFVGIALTPLLTHYLYKFQLWRKVVREFAPDGQPTPIFNRLHAEREKKVPRMGGLLIWIVPLVLSVVFWLPGYLGSDSAFFTKLNFLSRSQTWLPLFTLVAASLVGFFDDIFQVYGKGKYIAGGIRFTRRLSLIILIALVGAYWFYFKLEESGVFIPFFGEFELGALFPVFFLLVVIATFSGGVIDGIDGLAGGTLAAAFSAYAGIAYFQNQIDLAAFSAVIVGVLLSFLWFNIPPARFYMGETGIMGLTTALAVIAFLTDAVAALPIIAFPITAAALSSALQLAWKKIFGRKLFLVAPIHHYFEAIGWAPYTVTMRFWIVGVVSAIIGMVIALIGRG